MPKSSKAPDYLVRPMAAGDIAKALKLWRATKGVEVAEGDSPAQLKAFLSRNPGCSFVAVDGARLVGAVLAGYDGRRGLIYHLAVQPAARSRGLGRRLVEDALKALKAAGTSRVLILAPKGMTKAQASGRNVAGA